jgi:nucleotide-binding universal stress UspA family protein
MFKRILVAVDGSPASNAGLKSAATLAADQHAMLLALHVVDDSPMAVTFDGSYLPADYVDNFYETLRENGPKILAKADAVAQGSNVDLKPVLVEARGRTVADAIVQQAHKLRADVIVVGTHGRRGLRRVLMGSDAEAVVREAHVPVLLVRAPEHARRKSRASAKRAAPARATRPSATASSRAAA